jgi:cullin-associated NEDD8-dissociated protein 1
LYLAQFLPPAPVETFNQLLNGTLIPNLRATSISVQRADVQLIAAIARYTPQRLATGVREIVPGVLSLAAKEDSELREGALQALETLVYRCPTEITPFITSITSTAIQLIKYDPVRVVFTDSISF